MKYKEAKSNRRQDKWVCYDFRPQGGHSTGHQLWCRSSGQCTSWRIFLIKTNITWNNSMFEWPTKNSYCSSCSEWHQPCNNSLDSIQYNSSHSCSCRPSQPSQVSSSGGLAPRPLSCAQPRPPPCSLSTEFMTTSFSSSPKRPLHSVDWSWVLAGV